MRFLDCFAFSVSYLLYKSKILFNVLLLFINIRRLYLVLKTSQLIAMFITFYLLEKFQSQK